MYNIFHPRSYYKLIFFLHQKPSLWMESHFNRRGPTWLKIDCSSLWEWWYDLSSSSAVVRVTGSYLLEGISFLTGAAAGRLVARTSFLLVGMEYLIYLTGINCCIPRKLALWNMLSGVKLHYGWNSSNWWEPEQNHWFTTYMALFLLHWGKFHSICCFHCIQTTKIQPILKQQPYNQSSTLEKDDLLDKQIRPNSDTLGKCHGIFNIRAKQISLPFEGLLCIELTLFTVEGKRAESTLLSLKEFLHFKLVV